MFSLRSRFIATVAVLLVSSNIVADDEETCEDFCTTSGICDFCSEDSSCLPPPNENLLEWAVPDYRSGPHYEAVMPFGPDGSSWYACRPLRITDLEERRVNIVNLWVDRLNKKGIPTFKEKKSEGENDVSYAHILAGLKALKELQHGNGAYVMPPSTVRDDVQSSTFPVDVQNWTDTIDRDARDPGTHLWNSKWDFDMIDLIGLLHYFKNDSRLLTDKAAQNILREGFKKYIGQEKWHRHMNDAGGPVTENHALQTLVSIYLANQWVKENPRGWNWDTWEDIFGKVLRDKLLESEQHQHTNEGTALENTILQALGRIVHSDYFETNARPYQSPSLHSLQLLYTFSDSDTVRKAALNALDFTATKIAFQSFYGKRWTPRRRRHEYADELNLYDYDGALYQMLSLEAQSQYAYNFRTRYPGGEAAKKYTPAVNVLWAILLDYRIPRAINDFMQNKHRGYWARMQARFDLRAYRHDNDQPLYFNPDGSRDLDTEHLEVTPEFYFATPLVMNVSGGAYNRYDLGISDFASAFADHSPQVYSHGIWVYDFFSVPQYVFTKKARLEYFGHWWDQPADQRPPEAGPIREDLIFLEGNKPWWISNNSGTYKNFSYGHGRDFIPTPDRRTIHMDGYPMVNLPREVLHHRHAYAQVLADGTADWVNEFSAPRDRRVHFAFFDLTALSDYGFYLVVARIQAPPSVSYSLGFWEIAPPDRYYSVEEFVDDTLGRNNENFMRPADSRSPVFYRMTTGELLRLDPLAFESHEECRTPITGIWSGNPSGPNLQAQYYYDCEAARRGEQPLLEVHEVDDTFQYTGRIYAIAEGDGVLEVYNPFVEQRVTVDSSDYRNPNNALRTEFTGEIDGWCASSLGWSGYSVIPAFVPLVGMITPVPSPP